MNNMDNWHKQSVNLLQENVVISNDLAPIRQQAFTWTNDD